MNPQTTYLFLPDEVLINNVFSQLSVPCLSHLCQTNVHLNNICQNDHLWHVLIERDFGINIIPSNINNWQKAYIFYNKLLTQPLFAIPYVENVLLEKHLGKDIRPFYQKLLDTYKPAITDFSFTSNAGNKFGYIINRLALYDPKSKIFQLANSLDQVRVFWPESNKWENATLKGAYLIDLDFKGTGMGHIFEKQVLYPPGMDQYSEEY